MTRRFVIASMLHETNTFSPLPTPIEAFGPGGPLRGQAAIDELADTNYAIGGFIGLARQAGAEFVVPLAAQASPSGLVTRAAYEQMSEAIVDEIRRGCDAVMLDLHGAMVAEHQADVRYLEQLSGMSRATGKRGAGGTQRQKPMMSTVEIANVAQELLPTIKHHLQMAEEIQKVLQTANLK